MTTGSGSASAMTTGSGSASAMTTGSGSASAMATGSGSASAMTTGSGSASAMTTGSSATKYVGSNTGRWSGSGHATIGCALGASTNGGKVGRTNSGSGSGSQVWHRPTSSFQHAGQAYSRHSRQRRRNMLLSGACTPSAVVPVTAERRRRAKVAPAAAPSRRSVGWRAPQRSQKTSTPGIPAKDARTIVP